MNCSITACPQHSADKPLCALDTAAISESLPVPRNRSLVIASLELGRVLADRGKVTFRAQGTCMFPCIQPGDVLHVEARTLERVQVGEIAVFRRNQALFGHRVIEHGVQDGQHMIVTRPDRTREGDDGPAFAEEILGVVTVIERGGVRMPLHPQPLGCLAAWHAAAWEWWHWEVRPKLIEHLGALQQGGWYRSLASIWFRLVQPHLSFVVRVPLSVQQLHDLYREMPPEKFDLAQISWQGKPIVRWLLALHLNGAHSPAVSVTLSQHPEGCPRGTGWRVDELKIRARYRGAGLEQVLIQQAETLLARGGMKLGGNGHVD